MIDIAEAAAIQEADLEVVTGIMTVVAGVKVEVRVAAGMLITAFPQCYKIKRIQFN